MFDLTQLQHQLFIAPMAGGASTPELVAAACEFGASAFLAAGYKTVAQLEQQIKHTQTLTSKAFGVNVFVPDPTYAFNLEKWSDYQQILKNQLPQYANLLPSTAQFSDDEFQQKIAYLIANPVPIVSFTFGLPNGTTIAQLQQQQTFIIATVTSVHEAAMAIKAGVNALCVQSYEAGGHRATFETSATPNAVSLNALISEILNLSSIPIIAAGGLYSKEQIKALKHLGVSAVQLGTAFLNCAESGLDLIQKQQLHALKNQETILTRAYTGRIVRAVNNDFILNNNAVAPALYPELHFLTSPLRKTALQQQDPKVIALWAGTGLEFITRPQTSATEILQTLI